MSTVYFNNIHQVKNAISSENSLGMNETAMHATATIYIGMVEHTMQFRICLAFAEAFTALLIIALKSL